MSAALTSAGTVARVPESHVAAAQAPAVTHATAAVHGPLAIRVVATAPARIPLPIRAGTLVPVRAACRIPAWILASGLSGRAARTRAGVVVRAHTGLRMPARARILASPRAGVLVLTRAGILALARAGDLALIRAECRATRRAGAPVAIRVEVFHRAGTDRVWIPRPVVTRRPGSARAAMPRSGRGPGLTMGAADRAPTAGHGRMPRAVLARHRLGHGLPDRAANLVQARVTRPLTGTAVVDRLMLLGSRGRAAGVPILAPTRCRPARVHPCPATPSAPGAAAATVPARAPMRGVLRKRRRGTRVRDAAAADAAGPSRRHRTVQPRSARPS